MKQYDFEPDAIDENNIIGTIPRSIPQSLCNSRVLHCGSLCQALSQIHDQSNVEILNHSSNINEQTQLSIIKEEPKPKVRTVRDFNNFLKKQQAYEKRIQQKIARMKQDIQSKAILQTFQPQINKKSRDYAKENKTNVFSRLYQAETSKKHEANRSMAFQPHISEKSKKLVRRQPVGEILYKDAQLRKQKLYESIEKNKQQQTQYWSISHKNQQLAGKKLFKQYESILQWMELLPNHIISKEELTHIFFNMGFVTGSTPEEILDQCYQLVGKLGGNCVSVFGFLLVLIGVHHVDPRTFFSQDIDYIPFSEAQARALHNKFKALYNSRLHNEEKVSTLYNDPCTFKPQISQQSEYLAEKHRRHFLTEASKLMGSPGCRSASGSPKCKLITHPEFLLLNQKMKQKDLSIKREAELRKIMQQCTFKPKVSPFQLKKRRKSTRSRVSQGRDLLDSSMLVLEVDFNGQEEHIVLRAEDGHSLDTITQAYSNKYHMDRESEQELLSLLTSEYLATFPPKTTQ